MWQHIKNIYHLGIKELIELVRDKCMMILVVYAFTLGVYITAVGTPDNVVRAPIGIVDQDQTQLSSRFGDSFLLPMFLQPKQLSLAQVDSELDSGNCTFTLVIPPDYQEDTLAGKDPEIQLNVDATRMTQAFVGAGYIEQIIKKEQSAFVEDNAGTTSVEPATLQLRNRFNINLTPTWFGGVNQMVNVITMLAITLIGSALIRERERGTLEHLLVMPVEPFQIMCAKIWSMLVVVLIATLVAVCVILQKWLKMPIDGSLPLFMLGVGLHLFAVTSMGMFLACIAHNMPQMGMLMILVLMPMNLLSGGNTPRESMPIAIQYIMLLAPTTHFVSFCQMILFRGAGWSVVWKPYLALCGIGAVLFMYALNKFKQTASQS